MLPLAHLGIGSALVRPIGRHLPVLPLLVGTLLPDLIDKPTYLVLGLIAHWQNGGWVPGKRGFAHTLLFLLLLILIAAVRRSRPWAALALGSATHLVLDVVSKISATRNFIGDNLTVLLWPLRGTHFPTMSYGVGIPLQLCGEALGLALIVWLFWIRRYQTPRTLIPNDPQGRGVDP
jgi:membrane-bound metal-dependent hydrolase YbcI (DUF457 family)